jgi:Pyridoxamine 5'-phosphate oxidase
MAPTASKLRFPPGYGRATRTLRWAAVEAQLEEAKVYWFASTRPDGRPHVVPLDGIWVDDLWYYGGADETVHRRNVDANPLAALHLPDPGRAVIVEGEVRRTKRTKQEAARLAEIANAKYGYGSPASDYENAFALHPTKAIAWDTFPKDATRFTFAAT